MNFLIDGLDALWVWLKDLGAFWIGVFFTVAGALITIFDVISSSISSAVSLVGQLVVPSHQWPQISSMCDLINYIFPLTELFAFAVLLAGLLAVAITYRFIKSWIPTVS